MEVGIFMLKAKMFMYCFSYMVHVTVAYVGMSMQVDRKLYIA